MALLRKPTITIRQQIKTSHQSKVDRDDGYYWHCSACDTSSDLKRDVTTIRAEALTHECADPIIVRY